MTEEIEREEIEGEEPEQVEAPQVDPESEAEARKYGWKPKEEFTLAPEGWVAADRFLELPSTQVKMHRDLTRRLERELKDSNDKLVRVTDTVRDATERVRRQERERYDLQLQQLEAAKREAAQGGDVARYDELTRHQMAIRPPDPPADPGPPVDRRPPVVVEYAKTAAWMQDPAAYSFAQMAVEENKEVQRLPPMKQIAWAEKKVREFFPEHFPQEAPKPQFSKVDGGGMGPIGKRGRGVDDLPPDVRKIAQEFVDDKVFNSLEEYAASYFAQEKRA